MDTTNEPARPVLLTVAEAARRLSVSENCVYDLVKRKELAGVKIGKCVRVLESAVDAILSGATA